MPVSLNSVGRRLGIEPHRRPATRSSRGQLQVELLEGRALMASALAPLDAHRPPVAIDAASALASRSVPDGATVRGVVRSGESGDALPLAGARVRLYEASGGTIRLVGATRADAAGLFSVASNRVGKASAGVFYATADRGDRIQLASMIGTVLAGPVAINELTTVAAGYSMAQFTRGGAIAGPNSGLRIAAGMTANLVTTATGDPSDVLLKSPNGDESNSLRSTRSLANALASFVRTDGLGVKSFYRLATGPGEAAPTTFLQALANIARTPGRNVGPIYAQTQRSRAFEAALVRPPDAWTVAVKVNDTGDDARPFGGPANLAFDKRGYAWITNNVVQGQPYSSQFNVLLKPNGQPADGQGGTPRSPIVGGGILGAGFGVDIDPKGRVWMGNFGWGGASYEPSPQGNGSISLFDSAGRPISGPQGIQGGPDRAQGIAADRQGNIWIASYGNDRLYVFPKGDPNRSIFFQEEDGSKPFDVQIARDGTAWLTNSGGFQPTAQGSVARFALRDGRLVRLWHRDLGQSDKALALDSRGNAWVASGGDDAVYLVRPSGAVAGKFAGGGLNSPWGIAVDGSDNVWVSNFGQLAVGDNFRDAGVTKLAGVGHGRRAGTPLSPATGYTLPSAGAQVLLHDGTPLYGPQGPPSFTPLMRMTSVSIDRAGNVWAINNWKPRFNLDVLPTTGNPGGDGIVIFVGLAKPPAQPR